MSNRGVHSSRADRLSAAVVLQIEDGKIADATVVRTIVLCHIKVKHRNVLPRGMDASHSDQITALTSRKNCERWGVDCSSASGRLGPRGIQLSSPRSSTPGPSHCERPGRAHPRSRTGARFLHTALTSRDSTKCAHRNLVRRAHLAGRTRIAHRKIHAALSGSIPSICR